MLFLSFPKLMIKKYSQILQKIYKNWSKSTLPKLIPTYPNLSQVI